MNGETLPTEVTSAPSMPAAVPLTPLQLLSDALGRGAGIDTLDRLMALHERWEANEAKKQYDAAIALASAEMPVIEKDKLVSFDSRKPGAAPTSYKHATLGNIVHAVKPVLSKHGLSFRWRTTSEPNEPITVTCVLAHRAGHREENTLRAGRDDSGNKNSIQAVMSTVTYLCRYTLVPALGLAAAEDDDGATSETLGPLTPEQLADLQTKIRDAGISIRRFNERFNIDRLEDLPQENLQTALDAVAAYIAQKQETKQ